MADFLETLKDVLEETVYAATFIIGLESDLPGDRVGEFQGRLRGMGIDFGCDKSAYLAAEQVRTA